MGCYADNVITHRLDNGYQIAGFVDRKPIPIIILLKLIKEFEEVLRETVKLRHIKMDTCNNARNADSASSRAYTGHNCNTVDSGV